MFELKVAERFVKWSSV